MSTVADPEQTGHMRNTHQQPAGTVQQHPPSIQNAVQSLESLSSVEEDELSEVFMTSIGAIFAYAMPDVQSALGHFSKETLTKLHKTLCNAVIELFPQFRDRKPVNRQAAHKLLSDIVVMGISVSNEIAHKDLEKIFHPPSVNQSQTQSSAETNGVQSEVEELLTIVSSLRNRLTHLEKEVAQLQAKVQQGAEQMGKQTVLPNSDSEHVSSESETEAEDDVSRDNDVNDEFMMPREQRKKERRRARQHKRKVQSRECPSGSTSNSQSTDQPSHMPQPGPQPPALPKTIKPASTSTLATNSRSTGKPVAAAHTKAQATMVYVGGVSHENCEQDIKHHILSLGVASCEQVKILTSKGDWKSFTVEVPPNQVDMVCDHSKWPEGVRVRLFRPKRANSRFSSEGGDRKYQSGRQHQSGRWSNERQPNRGARRSGSDVPSHRKPWGRSNRSWTTGYDPSSSNGTREQWRR